MSQQKILIDLFLLFFLHCYFFCKKDFNYHFFTPTWNGKIISKNIEKKELVNDIMLGYDLYVSGEVYQLYYLKLLIQ